jgi:PKHD-type hydroxylase
VTRGSLLRCVVWIQSMIRDNGQRKILFDMDSAIQSLSAKMPDDPSIIKLSGVYHNLLRYWAQGWVGDEVCV